MDTRRLMLLRELADRGSVTAVAEAAHLTPSAVSQQLQVLEREAGAVLTERSGRGLTLTAHGRALAETARALAVAIERTDALWADYVSTPRGEVSLWLFPSAGEMLLPGLLRRAADIRGLELRCSDHGDSSSLTALAADHDLVVIDSPAIDPAWAAAGLATVPLLTEPLDVAMAAAHPLAAKRSLSPEEVVDQPWIGVPPQLPFDQVLHDIQSAAGRRARIIQRIADNGIVEALVAAGHGLAILPRFTTADRENGVVTRPLRGVRAERRIVALARDDRLERPSVRAVLDALSAQAAEVSAAHRGVGG